MEKQLGGKIELKKAIIDLKPILENIESKPDTSPVLIRDLLSLERKYLSTYFDETITAKKKSSIKRNKETVVKNPIRDTPAKH